jgi:NOL1/NOP2/fmu family ribosome biogenesis protein
MNLMDEFAGENLKISFEEQLIEVSGSYIYQLPIEAPDTIGLKVIHPGWWLGTIHNDYFTPSHSLAMGILSDHAMQVLGLQHDDQQLSAYLTGESFTSIGENGWVLVTIDDFPLGWGKRVQNVIKNYYPHGLRRL